MSISCLMILELEQTLHFRMHQMFSFGKRSGLQASSASFFSEPIPLEWLHQFDIILLKYANPSLKNTSHGWEHKCMGFFLSFLFFKNCTGLH